MTMNKTLIAILTVALLAAGLAGFASGWNLAAISAGFTLPFVLMLGVGYIMKSQGVALFAGLPILDRKMSLYGGVAVLVVGLFVMGGMNYVTNVANNIVAGSNAAQLVPGQVSPTSTAAASTCAASVAGKFIEGDTSSPVVNAYDKESTTPSTAVNTQFMYFYNGVFADRGQDSTAGNMSSTSVGSTVSVYEDGANTPSYYIDAVVDKCLDSKQPLISLNAYGMSEATDMALTCLDKNKNACSAGTNTTQETYDLTLGANQDEPFYAELTANSANEAFRLGGVALAAFNDIDDCDLADTTGWKAIAVPTFLKVVIDGSSDNAASDNRLTNSGYERVYELETPVMVHAWDSVQYKFIMEAGSTDPATNTAEESSDVCVVNFLDASWAKDSNGNPVLSTYQHDEAEGNVGVVENLTAPVLGDTGFHIEGL